MRVWIDDQVFALQKRGGISRYFTELIREFGSDPSYGVDVVTPYRYVLNDHLIEMAPERYRRPPLPGGLMHPRVVRRINSLRRPPRPVDIIHHTYYLPGIASIKGVKSVCTVYDMIPELFPDEFQHNPHLAKQQYVQSCDAVFCISNTTKRDLSRVYGNLDKPVLVTYLGVHRAFFDAARRTVEEPYALHVGTRDGYKNFDLCLRALALVGSARRLRLVCVGPPFAPDELTRIAELGLSGRVTRLATSDEDLPRLYAGAEMLLYPSRYEGFGLPLVEAFAAGCPVVAAESPCTVEIAEDCARYASPDDAAAFADGISTLLGDPRGRDDLVARGRLRAKQFTWTEAARRTADAYAMVL